MGDTQRAIGASERLLGLLHMQSHIKNPNHPKAMTAVNVQGVGVSFDNLLFSYPSNPTPVIQNLNLNIKPGELIAVVGRSGAGKSTLFQLLQRFYDPQEGSIAINDTPIQEFDLKQLRRLIGIVPQDITIFRKMRWKISVMAYPLPRITTLLRQQKLRLLMNSFLDYRKAIIPFSVIVGFRLSGGQRQRIGIARTLLKNPSLLLLDEATSALDSRESERLIQVALEKATINQTTIVIAHRLATESESYSCHGSGKLSKLVPIMNSSSEEEYTLPG
jgi:ATP-binding cassette subfamily B protein